MAYEYSDLIAEIEAWTQQSINDGWIDQQQANFLTIEQQSSANELFANNSDRPLVVAFMGGTGVGKSSLLNKLSGQAIAKTGEVRPTSKEVTLYHHQLVSLHQLQETFPLQDIQIAQHADASNQHVLWIDMPDFDSTEEKNKHIVMQWLPYVDVLIYVVSPERYRDNKAWQLLLAEGASHAWLFVMNQWDRGDSSQLEDFKQQLAKAGFDNPIIFKTICHLEQALEQDELPQLKQSITALATANTVEQLEQRNLQQRNDSIKKKLLQCLQALANEQVFVAIESAQLQRWQQTKEQLRLGFEWPVKQWSLACAKTANVPQQDKTSLWDEWAQSRFNDYLDELILTADQQGLASTPLRNILAACRGKAGQHIQMQAELGCRKALINPGNIVQRGVLKLARLSEVLLPIVTMSVVGYQVFQGFYQSAVTDQQFLGVDFAVHSVLLISISWLLPYFISKKMRPSLEKAATKGLSTGVEAAMSLIEIDVQQGVNEFKAQHQKVAGALQLLLERCDQQAGIEKREQESEQLARMLVNSEDY